jgi:hypothetical protein
MEGSSSNLSRGTGLGRVAGYYVLFVVGLAAAITYVPLVSDVVGGGGLRDIGTQLQDSIFGPDTPPPVGTVIESGTWSLALLAAISMLGALAVMIPVTWVYMITRKHRGYHESVVHTLLILPVAVTGIVMVVKNDLALAFALAGIVAAVRFRTTLEDTKDAVYVFLAIGVGLTCGVQAVGIALVLSVFFNLVILALWATQFGNIYADQHTRSGPLSLGDVLAGPASAASVLQVGDPGVLDAAAPADLAEIADRAVRMERHISEERTKKKTKRVNALILVHAKEAGPAQTFVDQILDELATRYKLAEVAPGPDGVMLEYIARLDGTGVQGAVMDRIRAGGNGVVTASELRSLKGLKPRT